MIKRLMAIGSTIVLSACMFTMIAFAVEPAGDEVDETAPVVETIEGGATVDGEEPMTSPDEGQAGEAGDQESAPAPDESDEPVSDLVVEPENDAAAEPVPGPEPELAGEPENADAEAAEPAPRAVAASEDETSPFTYELTYTENGDGTLTITGFTGTASGDLVIPETIEVKGVTCTITAIAPGVFENQTGFTGLILPDTITSIGDSAFKGCSGLTGTWDLPTSLTSLGSYAFSDCLHMSGAVTIPAGITSVPDYCFYMSGDSRYSSDIGVEGVVFAEGSQLASIGAYAFAGNWFMVGGLNLPDTVTSIGDYAFNSTHSTSDSTYLRGAQGTLHLPEGIQYIGEGAFYLCDFAGDLVIPNGAVVMGDKAFQHAGFTGTLTIPEGVASISNWCFSEDGFTGQLQIPSTVTTIGYDAFWRCRYFDATLVIPEGVTEIGSSAFSGFAVYSNTTGTLSLPSTLTTIGESAFFDSTSFVGALVIPDSVETIGKSAFNACRNFTSLKLPENPNYTTIAEGTFGSVWNYQMGFTGELVIPENVTVVGKEAFEYCGKFTGNLTLPSGLTAVGDGAFQQCRGFTGTLTLPSGLETIGNEAFLWCDGLTSLVIPNTVASIGERAFQGCENMGGDLVIPGSVKTIGRQAFQQFGNKQAGANVGTLTIENGVESIGDGAFSSARAFTGTVSIPASVEPASVGRNVFNGCTGLTGFVLPEGWTSIPQGLFYSCTGLSGEFSLPAGIATIGSDAFRGCTGYTGTLVIPASVTTVGDSAFRGCTGFTGYELPSNWTAIPNGMFDGWTGLTGQLSIPAGITSIGNEAFHGCKNLSGDLAIPSGVTTIGDSAFSGCTGFTGNLIIPDTVTKIGASAFGSCSGLTGSLTIPESVTQIGSGAFEFCPGLTGDVTIPSAVSTLPRYLFYGCTGLTGTLTIPEGVTRGYYETLNKAFFSTIVNNSAVQFNQAIIVEGTSDYYVDTSGAKVDVIGTGTYTRVTPPTTVDLSGATISGIVAKTYTGKALTQSPVVTVNGKTLEAGTDYKVTYKNNTNAGTATVTVTGVESAGYVGSKSTTFKISAKKVTPAVTLAKTSYVYDGKVKKPAVTVKIGSTKLTTASYTVTYASGRKLVGAYKVTVKLKGNYSGSKTVTFKVIPKGTSVKSLAPASKAFTAKWGKQATQTTGYQLQYCASKAFKSGVKTVTIGKTGTVSKKVTGLKAKTTYYVKVRTYKTVGKTKYYSAWSAVKAVKTK